MKPNGSHHSGNHLTLAGVFLAAVSIFLWGSFAGITDLEVLEQRELAAQPELERLADVVLLAENFEAYFSDHFLVRNRLITADRWLRVNLFGQRYFGEVAIAGDGWLFYNQPVMTDDCQQIASFSADALRRMQDAMLKASAAAAENGVELHYLIAPNKCTVYPEYSAEVFPVLGGISRADQVLAQLAGQDQISVIDLRETMKGFKGGELIYYPDDTHWNDRGMFLMHAAVIARLLPDLPTDQYLRVDDFRPTSEVWVGDLSMLLGLDQFVTVSQAWEPVKAWATVDEPEFGVVVIENPDARTDQTLLISHDSFFQPEMIRSLFSHYYERVILLHDNRGFQWDSNPAAIRRWIKEWQPDVILVEKTERTIHNFARDTSGE